MLYFADVRGQQSYLRDHQVSVRLNMKLFVSIFLLSILYFIIDTSYYFISDMNIEISYPVLMSAIGFQLLKIVIGIFYFKYGSNNSFQKFCLLERIFIIIFTIAAITNWNLQLNLDDSRAHIVGIDVGWTFLYTHILFTNLLGKTFVYISIILFGLIRAVLSSKILHFGVIQSGFQFAMVILTVYLVERLKREKFLKTRSLEETEQTFKKILNNLPENIAILNLQGEMIFYNTFLDISFKVSEKLGNVHFFSQIYQVKPRERHFDLKKIQERYHLSRTPSTKFENFMQKKIRVQSNNKPPSSSKRHVDKYLAEEVNFTNSKGSRILGLKDQKGVFGSNKHKFVTHVPYTKSLTEVLASKDHFESLQETLEFFCVNVDILRSYGEKEKSFFIFDGKYETNEGLEKSFEIKISLSNFDSEESLIVILRDTTQRDIIVTLEDNNKFKDGVLSSISHELRTPLNTNLNLIELAINSEFCNCIKTEEIIPQRTNRNDHSIGEINEGSIVNNVKDSLLIPAHQSGKLLESIINDILDYSMLLGRKFIMNIKEKYLLKSLQKVRYMCEFQARKKNLEFHISLSQKLNHQVGTDHRRLRQILINILNNAIRFTNKGYVILKVEPYGENLGVIKFSVKDSGIGIDGNSLSTITANLNKGNVLNKLNKDASGIGMGLTISNLLAKELGPSTGRTSGIKIESSLNEGSNFWFLVENCVRPTENLGQPADGAIFRRSRSEYEFIHFSQLSKCSTGGVKLLEVKTTPNILSPKAQQNNNVEFPKFKDTLNTNQATTNEAILTKDDLMDEEIAQMIKNDNLKVSYIETKLLKNDFSSVAGSKIEKGPSEAHSLKESRGKSNITSINAQLNNLRLKIPNDDVQSKAILDEKEEDRKSCLCPEILVVDDDMFNIFTMESLLSSLGLKISKAIHGEEAIKRVQKRKELPCSESCKTFKLIFMDLSMPVMDGFQATLELKELMNTKEVPEIPIIACTAFVDNEKTQKCYKCGMLGKISKPVTRNKLKEVLVKHNVLTDEDEYI